MCGYTCDDVLTATFPLFHVAGTIVAGLSVFMAGAQIDHHVTCRSAQSRNHRRVLAIERGLQSNFARRRSNRPGCRAPNSCRIP